MECLTSINTDILNSFRTKWINNKFSLSYKKMTADILKAVILTDVARLTLLKCSVYTLEFQKYEREISILRPDINAYKFYITAMHDLEDEGYFYCIEKGYRSVDEEGEVFTRPSVYCTHANFINYLSLLYVKNKNITYTSLDLQKFHDKKQGITRNTIYSYQGKEYNRYNDIRADVAKLGVSIIEFESILKDAKNNNLITTRTETYVPLDDCIVSIGTDYIRKVPLNYSKKETIFINKEMVSWFGDFDYNSSTQRMKNFILISSNIADEMGEDGSLTVYYHDTKNGRLYLYGMNLQMMAKEYRNKILSYYVPIDMKAAFFSIMYNYIQQSDYKEDTPYLKRFFDDPDGYRKHLHEQLKEYDPEVEYKYVKTALTSIGYGAHGSEKQVAAAVNFNHKSCALVNTKGYYKKDTPEVLVSLEDFKGVYNELNSFKKFLIKKIKNSGKTKLTNAAGCVTNISSTTADQLISFIYQGIEVTVLLAISDYFKKLRPNSVGLLLHDGLYVLKECISDTIIEDVEQYVLEKTGYSLKFSLETE